MTFCIENSLNWLYIDMNSYFATVEQQVNPDLRNKPVAIVPVLSDSATIIAASKEAKKFGVKTGVKIYQAKEICPEIILVKARQELYIKYHHKIFQEIDLYLHVDHIFSIDEGACRLTGKYRLPQEALAIGRVIQKAIKNNIGEYITCSIGIGPNRYLAKIASNLQKFNGLSVIMPSELPDKLYSLQLKSLPGIGVKTAERLIKNGISSIEELCNYDKVKLRALWGNIWGEKIWYLIRGADLPLEDVKNSTISQSQVLAPVLQQILAARGVLIALVLKAASRLRSKDLCTNSILLAIELMSKKSIQKRSKISLSNDSTILLKSVLRALDDIVITHKIAKIKKISISFNNLQKPSNQLSFLDVDNQKKRQKLSSLIDYLNKKHGRNAVTIGTIPKKNPTELVVAFGHIPNFDR